MRSTDRSVNRTTQAGFTLIEVMLVVVILGILAGVAVASMRKRVIDGACTATRTTIGQCRLAIRLFEVDNGVFPNSLDELIADTGYATWRGPYFEKSRVPRDAWGKPLQYGKTDSAYEIVSAGPDGRFGTGDDITD